jgi:hypothetical protein
MGNLPPREDDGGGPHLLERGSVPAGAVVRFGQRTSSTIRIASHHIRDIDVRDIVDKGMQVGVIKTPTSPSLIIERTEGEMIAIKTGLSREELEWVADRLRRELAEAPDARRQEPSVG